MDRSYFQSTLEELSNLVVRMQASVQWQRLFVHEAQGSAAFGTHFYESELRRHAHLDSQWMTTLIRLCQELHSPLAKLTDKERSEFLKAIKHLRQQICGLDTHYWGC